MLLHISSRVVTAPSSLRGEKNCTRPRVKLLALEFPLNWAPFVTRSKTNPTSSRQDC